jgi:Fe-S-cluster containining protein
MFNSIDAERFSAFHNEFKGDTWDTCELCGGKCEINKIGSLMPGEAEYIAASLGTDVQTFRATFLDGIATPYGVVDVLKLKPGCPFLSPDFRCTIKDVKVVLCDVYPVVFDVEHGQVVFSMDEWCPIVRYRPQIAAVFESDAIPALQRLDAPVDWYRAVQMYDSLCVDYDKLYAKRATEPGYAVLTLEQILDSQDDDAPPPELRVPSAPDNGQFIQIEKRSK